MTENDETVSTEIVNAIQSGFPVVEKPFHEIGENLGMSGENLMAAIRSMLERGLLRTFGPVFDPIRLGYVSTLVAAHIDQDRVAELSSVMLEIREVTHNYLRDHELNLWFTITALNCEVIDSIIKQVEKFPGVKNILNLPAVRIYKIRAVFGTSEYFEAEQSTGLPEMLILDDNDKMLVRKMQENFPIHERPYRLIAEKAGMSEEEALTRISRMVEKKVIRRFGARVNHRRAGYISNCLGAWRGDDIDVAGVDFSRLPFVSHCYRRMPHNDWPYELYTMIHAVSNNDLKDKQNEMRSLAPHLKPVFMKSLYELKKTTMKYFLEQSEIQLKRDRKK